MAVLRNGTLNSFQNRSPDPRLIERTSKCQALQIPKLKQGHYAYLLSQIARFWLNTLALLAIQLSTVGTSNFNSTNSHRRARTDTPLITSEPNNKTRCHKK